MIERRKEDQSSIKSDMAEEDKFIIFKSFVDNFMDDAIVGLTKKLEVSLWSKGAETKLGYRSDEIVGKNIKTLVPDDKINEFENKIELLKKGKAVKNIETTRKHKNGTAYDVSVSISPIYDLDGAFNGAIGIYRDIYKKGKPLRITGAKEDNTDKKSVELELLKKCLQLEMLTKEAEASNRAKSQFLANMSHEIRTPMNGILGTIQLLQLTELNYEQSRYTKMLKESAEALLAIVNDILDVSKIESKVMVLNKKPFDLKETIRKIHDNLLVTGNTKGLEISFYMDPAIEAAVIGDELRLGQVLTNLISNAVKFTEEGQISLRAEKLETDNDIQRIRFTVKDTGIGIEDDFKDKIFQIFNQGDLSYSKKSYGSGLGLAISREIAMLMNGDITFKTKVGEGSSFCFVCDLHKPGKTAAKPQEEHPDPGIVNSNKAKYNKVILGVEDNMMNQEVMESIVRKLGYHYLEAYNGCEALEILKSREVDLILMDIQMPDLNGYETTKIIRKQYDPEKHIPIIGITAYAMQEDKLKCIQAGMDYYISKPFDVESLHQIFEKYLSE